MVKFAVYLNRHAFVMVEPDQTLCCALFLDVHVSKYRWMNGKSVDPDKTPRLAASELGLHCACMHVPVLVVNTTKLKLQILNVSNSTKLKNQAPSDCFYASGII